jgi:hypothetical protein
MKQIKDFNEFITECFHMPDGTPIGVDRYHQPVKITEEADNRVTLNVTIKNLDKSTAADFVKMFAFMEWCGSVGAGRSFKAYFDGDGHFRPDIKIEGHDLNEVDFSSNWNSNEDTVTLDFGA